MRDRLIELLKKAKKEYAGDVTDFTETRYIAECLLNDGWMRPPCKVGDKIYKIFTTYTPFVSDYDVEAYGIPVKSVLGDLIVIPFDAIGKTVFLSREEAEKALKGDEGK